MSTNYERIFNQPINIKHVIMPDLYKQLATFSHTLTHTQTHTHTHEQAFNMHCMAAIEIFCIVIRCKGPYESAAGGWKHYSWTRTFARQFAVCSAISLFTRQFYNSNDNLTMKKPKTGKTKMIIFCSGIKDSKSVFKSKFTKICNL